MNIWRKIIIFVLVLTLSSVIAVSAFAANDIGVTYEMTIDTPVLNVSSEAQTVTITVKANKSFLADSVTAQFTTPSGFRLNAISNTELGYTSANTNTANGKISWYSVTWNDELLNMDMAAQTVAVFTCTVPANTAAGTYTFQFYIENITNNFFTLWESGTTLTATLTIKEAAPACDHVGKTYTYTKNEGADTHEVVCECGETVKEAENCTGGIAYCKSLKVCEYCNAEYGSFDDNNHPENKLYWTSNNSKHYQKCDDCKKTIGSGDHTEGSVESHRDGNCQQTEKTWYICGICSMNWFVDGEKNLSNHASTEITYVEINASTHTVKHDCCGNTDAAVAHDYDETTHKCVCGAVENVCNHADTKVVSNKNGTHDVVCANTECKEIVEDDVPCSGGTANCVTPAKCSVCGEPYGTALGHIDENPKDHECDRNCGKTDMGDHESNAEYACQAGICEYCGEVVAASANHTGGTATCTKKAECEKCGAEYGSVESHDLIHVEYKEYTCYEDGNIEYWYCETCNAAWFDPDCIVKVGLEWVVLPANHKYGDLILATEAVHTQTELKGAVAAHYYCDVCYTYFTADMVQTTLEDLTSPAPQHTGGIATCTEQATCSECGQPYGDKNVSKHTGKPNYTTNGDGTHSATQYECCSAPFVVTGEEHTYSYEVCTACGAKAFKVIAFNEYNATWNGNYVDIYKNGVKIASLTKGTTGVGKYNEIYIEEYDPTAIYAVYWNRVDDQKLYWRTSVTFYVGETGKYYVAEEMDAFVNGQLIYPVCEHNDSVKEYTDNENGTHDVFCNGCNLVVLKSQAHTYDTTTHKCVCGAKEHVHAHDHYDITENTHQSICSCGETIGEPVRHFSEYEATCFSNETCFACGKVMTQAGHGYDSGFEYEYSGDDGDWNIHTLICNDCGESIGDPVSCSDEDSDGDHKCDDCGHENVTAHTGNYYFIVVDLDGFYAAELRFSSCTDCYDRPETIDRFSSLSTKNATCTELGENTYYFGFSEVVLPEGWNWENCELWFLEDDMVWDEQTKILTLMKTTPVDPNNHASADISYVNITEDTHTVKHVCCGNTDAPVAHSYDTTTHKCACGNVEKFTLTIYSVVFSGDDESWNNRVDVNVPYGALLKDYIPETDGEEGGNNPILQVGESVTVSGSWYEGTFIITGWRNRDTDEEIDTETMTMPANNLRIYNDYSFTGWQHEYYDYDRGEWSDTRLGTYYLADGFIVTGWAEIGGSWYYFDEETFFRAEGISRAPYPIDAINGITYAPDQDALDYVDKNPDKVYPDAKEAWFLFGEDGKFMSDTTGMGTYNNATRYMVNGMLAWHPGLIKIGEDYYYFIGDVDNGGNIAADGEIYISYNNGYTQFQVGGIYTFKDGKLVGKNGILTEDDKLFYYVNNQKMVGLGLVEYDGGYIYVRSNGELATGVYYVGNNKYDFGTTGIAAGLKNGIIDGYYYDNGHIAYGAGLVEYEDGYIYVRSNGQVVMNQTYWITNVGQTGIQPGKYEFDENGMMKPVKNGIVDGKYYINNHIQYGAGLVKIGEDIYYVRSNGQVATGTYYVTNTNGMEGFSAGQKLVFDENGKLITE